MARADGDAFIGEWSVIKSLIRRAQQVGLARAVCIVLLFALVPLRLADPRPLEELRVAQPAGHPYAVTRV